MDLNMLPARHQSRQCRPEARTRPKCCPPHAVRVHPTLPPLGQCAHRVLTSGSHDGPSARAIQANAAATTPDTPQVAQAPAINHDEPLDTFIAWLANQGVTSVGQPTSKVQLVQLTPTERGLCAAKAIVKDEVVMRIPLGLLMLDEPQVELYEGCANSVRLASKLLREKALGTKSFWYPYLCTLPRKVPCLVHVKDLSEWAEFQYPALRHTVDNYRTLLRQAYKKCPKEALAGASFEDFLWAMTIVNSRSFQADGWELMMWATDSQAPGAGTQPQPPADHDPSSGWWASNYLGMVMRAAGGNNTGINAAGGGTAGAAAAVGAAQSPARPVSFLSPLLDMLNHAQRKEECAPGAAGPGQIANIKWYLRPRPGAQPAPAKPAATTLTAPTTTATGFQITRKKGKGSGKGTSKVQGQPSKVESPQMQRARTTPTPVTEWELQGVAIENIGAGDPLLLCYKPGEGNDAFALHYGFVPGYPGGNNTQDDVWLFDKGLPQALQWHCQVYAAQEPPLLPLLGQLDNKLLLSVYQEAYDTGSGSLTMDGLATESPIKVRAGGHAPRVLLDAFSAILPAARSLLPGSSSAITPQTSQAASGTDTKAANSSAAAAAQTSRGATGASSAGSRSTSSEDAKGRGLQHAKAALARYCVDMLRERTPLLHDMEMISAWSAAAQRAKDAGPAAAKPVSQAGHATGAGVEGQGAEGAGKAEDSRPIEEAVTWLQELKGFQQRVEAAAEQLVALPAASGPAAALSIGLQADGLGAAAQLLDLAGYGQASQGAPAGAGSEPSGVRELAVRYRINKKRILWEVLLRCKAEELAAALYQSPEEQQQQIQE